MSGQSAVGPRARFELASLLVGLALTILLGALWFIPMMRVFELKMLDSFFALKGPPEHDPGIVHIDIDDSSIEKIGRWPWDRFRHAQLVDVLTEAGAQAIIYDITFPDPQSEENDAAFISSCAVSDNVYIGFNLNLLDKSAFLVQSLPWYAPARRELLSDITLGPEELASRLGAGTEEIEPFLTRVKEAVIEEELRRRIGKDKDVNPADFLREITPAEKLCEGGFEDRTVRRIYERLSAEDLLAESALKSRSGELIEGRSRLTPPIPGLVRAAKGCGFVSVEPDRSDGVLRHIPLLRSHRGRLYSYLSLVVLRDIRGLEISHNKREIIFKSEAQELKLPLDEQNEVLLDWASVEDFERVPFAAVVQIADMREAALRNLSQEALTSTGMNAELLRECDKLRLLKREAAASAEPKAMRDAIVGQQAICMKEQDALLARLERLVASAKRRGVKGEQGEKAEAFDRLVKGTGRLLERAGDLVGKLRKEVEGKICIVGATHTGSTDLHQTSIATEVPGCMAHSTLLSMFYARSFPREPWRWSSLVMLVLAGSIISLVSARLSALRSVVVTVAALLGLSAALFSLFASGGIFLGLASPVSSMVLAFAGTAAYRRFAEERARRKVRSIFQRQVGEAVAEQLIRGGEEIKLGGEMRTATVYFSDIAGFSTISEKLTPPELVELLNEYFSIMCVPVVETYGGYLDKFEGDAILAVFGVPLAGENHARDACFAALQNQEALAELRQKLSREGKPEIRQRIGISTGEMVVGYVGSPQRHDYTVLGDAVNLGQRLEAANKLYRTSIIISESTYELAREFIEVRELDLARVPGRMEPVKTFELACKKGDLPESKREAFELFARALAHYRGREFSEALALFKKILELLPGDGPSQLYIKRCRDRLASGTPKDWDGVHDVGLK